jgi:hypothetical protein
MALHDAIAQGATDLMMFKAQSGQPVRRRGRLRLAGLALAAAALIVGAPATADASSMYVHSAASGKLAGGRLTLYGVGPNVTWTTTGGHAGVARVTRAHKQLFSPKTPATGTLHIAGHRGGDELAFTLSDPRYNAARRTVSYRAKPIAKRIATASAATAAAPRSFGSASLSVLPHATVASGSLGGNDCEAGFDNSTWYGMAFVSSSKWDSDFWEFDTRLEDGFIAGNPNIDFPAPGAPALQFTGTVWESDGGLWRGCANHTTWKIVTDPEDPAKSGTPPDDVTIDFNLEWDWGQLPSFTCATSNPRFTCVLNNDTQRWGVYDTERPPR